MANSGPSARRGCQQSASTCRHGLDKAKPTCSGGAYPFVSLDGHELRAETVVYELAKRLPSWIYYYLPPSDLKPAAKVVGANRRCFS